MEKKNDFSFFCNKDCQFFPCHENADPENFNCLFCYCPLYALGKNCGGNFKYLPGGVKDCSACTLPHSSQGYAYVTRNYDKIVEIMKKQNDS